MKTYSIKSYPSNVEIFVSITDRDGYISGGRVAMIECSGDYPSLGKTSGVSLGMHLSGIKDIRACLRRLGYDPDSYL
jgi:hypothetical protein